MQAVILAAGRGTRMGSLVDTVPKPMLMAGGKTLLEHKFDILPDDVDEIIVVTGYLGNVIKDHYGTAYRGKRLTYVTQENIVGGTADALWAAKDVLKDTFVVLMGDDLYVREDIEACRAFEWSLLVRRVPDTAIGGKVVTDIENRVVDIIEGNSGGEGIVNTNMFALDTRIFSFPQVQKSPGSHELGLPQTVLAASKSAGIPLQIVEAVWWFQITNPEDIRRFEGQESTA